MRLCSPGRRTGHSCPSRGKAPRTGSGAGNRRFESTGTARQVRTRRAAIEPAVRRQKHERVPRRWVCVAGLRHDFARGGRWLAGRGQGWPSGRPDGDQRLAAGFEARLQFTQRWSAAGLSKPGPGSAGSLAGSLWWSGEGASARTTRRQADRQSPCREYGYPAGSDGVVQAIRAAARRRFGGSPTVRA